MPISDFDDCKEKDAASQDMESNFLASNSTAIESEYCQCVASAELCHEDACDVNRSKGSMEDLFALNKTKAFDNADLDKN